MLKSSSLHFDVLVVGAGFSGLYLLYRLRKLGLSVRVIERGGGIGGTWYWNRYPGARCDIESMQYSYQFSDELQQEWEWSERYSSQAEILRYAEHVAARFALQSDIQLNTTVVSASYHDEKSQWEIQSDNGDTFRAQFLIMATGCLSQPNKPNLHGMETFAGGIYHTALWPHESVNFSGRRVGVIGTGSTAIQLIPEVSKQAESVTVFQRTANFSIPGHNKFLDPTEVKTIKENYAELRANAKKTPRGVALLKPQKLAENSTKEEMFADFEWRWQYGGLGFLEGFSDLVLKPEHNQIAVEFVHNKIRQIVNDEKTASLLCPTNIIGGKRLCVDNQYFETYNQPHVELIDIKTRPLPKIYNTGISVGNKTYELDDIILATGFDAISGALLNIDITGKSGLSLKQYWRDGPSSYLGLAMSGFPNLFTITGPGSPSVLTNMLCSIEQHVEWITNCLQYMQNAHYTQIEAIAESENQWWQHVQEMANSALKTSTKSWYRGNNMDKKPDVFMPYLGGLHNYSAHCESIAKNNYDGFHFR